MNRYKSTASLLSSNKDISKIKYSNNINPGQNKHEGINSQSEQNLDSHDDSRSLDFTLPKISRLNSKVSKTEMDASKISVTLK